MRHIIFPVIAPFLVFAMNSAEAEGQPAVDTETAQACLGVGVLSKEAGELRDKGMGIEKVREMLAQRLAKKRGAKLGNARKVAALPASLAFANTQLQPWTLHALGTKVCIFASEAALSEETLAVLYQYALVCQEESKDSKSVNACMSQLDGLLGN